MGYIKKRINELSKEHGGKTKASRYSEEWFQNGIKSRKVKEAQITRTRFDAGKIYVFGYEPKFENELPWFDENPVVLAIEQTGKNDFGVNLNLLPIPVKEQLLDDLYGRLEGAIKSTIKKEQSNPLHEKPLKISYIGMKKYLEKFGCDFALRQYIPSRKINQAVVSYSKWPEIALCDFMELNGTNVVQIRAQFRDYFKKNI